MGEFAALAFIMIVLMLAYWSFVTLPRQRLFRKQNQYVRTMQTGDEVITAGGIIGTIASMDTEHGIAFVRIAEGIEVKVLTSALSRPFDAEEIALVSQIGIDPAAEEKLRQRA